MNPRAIVSDDDLELLRALGEAKDASYEAWRAGVLAVAARSSVRSAAKAAGISPDTITVWRRDQ